MNIVVHLDRARLFRWQLAVTEALRAAGHDMRVQFRDTQDALPVSLTAILDFDFARTRAGPERFSARLLAADFAAFSASRPAPIELEVELEIDLSTASAPAATSKRTLRPHFDGSPKDHALFHALLHGHAPLVTLADSNGHVWPIGRAALETPSRLAASLDQSISRLVEGVILTVARIAAGERPPPPPSTAGPVDASRRSLLRSAGTFASQRAYRKLGRVRERVGGDAPKWHVGWRKLANDALPQPGLLDVRDFQILPDDGQRYYADPFAFGHEGTTHVFIEEFPAHTQKGIISHFTISEDGNASKPAPVLNAPHHLSYPQVFAHGGEIWMLPEAAASGGLDLYRAERFPDRWVKAQRIIDVALHDATLFSHLGHFWIAAATTAYQSSSWDALSLFWSDKLTGPWRPHARNPVLVDATSARPAGAFWQDGGNLIRASQDCSRGYGGQMTLKHITTLDPRRFEEITLGPLSFARNSQILGPHTLTRAGGFELIDLYARLSVVRAGSRETIAL